MEINNANNESSCGYCYRVQFASTSSISLTRRLLAVVAVCTLTATIVFARWVPLIPWPIRAAGLPASCRADAVRELDENVYSVKEVPVRRLPQCIIPGVMKGGTRALLEFLNVHPDVRALDHEIGYFSSNVLYRKGIEWYRKNMPTSYTG